MKIIYLSFCIYALFLAQTFGCDSGDDYAHELWNNDKKKMVATGVSSLDEINDLENKGANMVSAFVDAQNQGNSTQAEAYRVAFSEYVERLLALSAKS